jgi:hypothetical protein
VSAFPGIELANVYGVEVPGGDGRAGMAALVVGQPESFDTRAFYEHAVASLPSYAVPVFVRLQSEAEVTGTFKLRKIELQREGWNPATLADPLFMRDDAARAYAARRERHRAVAAGKSGSRTPESVESAAPDDTCDRDDSAYRRRERGSRARAAGHARAHGGHRRHVPARPRAAAGRER